MFDPNKNTQLEKQKSQAVFRQIETWCEALIPSHIVKDCQVSVQEMACGDPQCSPVDTAVTLMFKSGGQGIFGLPMEAKDVTQKEIQDNFPTQDVLEKWHRGEEADWPPMEPISLRFDVGASVLCRTGPTEWAPGKVVDLWYREQGWPPGSFAPYKILLNDGRNIYAPADMDQVIRLNPNA
mmetsp:Transcript_11500/g.25675  ORF Transcript_11500/g.25675 Transcript_11500/m.25675 type:complete len:181 (+) Transcript_11500:161-703(+)|eukprot:CAMPEP_0168749818 /NCGR_PEP_ID=MMETSP0724-20121128/16928_1 /TAXON_ID=265536 /ORGANISM="Amphiprora sp., Strain CCMP467" /LENGTH=180 /DNA_ID=CAMNT_0008797771 /DNA_START=186 /DNA_END=728 /DNA_ORIENTATION=-